MQFIDLQAQYRLLEKNIGRRLATVLEHGSFIMGPEIFELEEMLAEYVGVSHAVSCANGTDALVLALMCMDVGPGDAVFVPTFTFFATAEAVSFLGATPIFVDSAENSFNMCGEDLERRISAVKRDAELTPKVIIAVDLFGMPCDYQVLNSIASRHQIKLLEDAAQGFGGGIRDENGKTRRAGSFGDIATTSFFPAKPLGCYGDGGALFTDDDEYADRMRSLRVHGKGASKYDNVRIGMNSRLDSMQAAILLEKLTVFPAELESRQQIADEYSKALVQEYQIPKIPRGFTSSWAQFTLVAESRESRTRTMKQLEEKSVPCMIYYDKCVHQQVVYQREYGLEGQYPCAENYSATVFSLPMHPYLTKEDQWKVISALGS